MTNISRMTAKTCHAQIVRENALLGTLRCMPSMTDAIILHFAHYKFALTTFFSWIHTCLNAFSCHAKFTRHHCWIFTQLPRNRCVENHKKRQGFHARSACAQIAAFLRFRSTRPLICIMIHTRGSTFFARSNRRCRCRSFLYFTALVSSVKAFVAATILSCDVVIMWYTHDKERVPYRAAAQLELQLSRK